MSATEPARSREARPFERHPGRGSGTRLWLARHAEVHPDWQGKAYGNLDVPLSCAGVARTRELALALAALPPDLVRSSPLGRALELARAVHELSGAPLEVDPRLEEIERGAWQGRSVEELHRDEPGAVDAFYADPWSFRGHGGESDAALAERVWPAIDEALERRPATLLVATHYNVIRVIAARALGIPPQRSFGLRVDPGRLVLLHDAPGGWRLLASNVETPRPVREAGSPVGS